MKNRKTLVLAVLASFLTACGAETEIPRNYTKVDINNKESAQAFENKFQNALKKTETASNDGVKSELSLELGKFLYKEGEIYKSDKISSSIEETEIKDLKLKATSISSGLSEVNSIKDVKAILKIEDFGFKYYTNKETFSYVDENTKQGRVFTEFGLKIKDVDVYAYVNDGKLYLDLSDNDLAKAINDTVEFIISASELTATEKAKLYATRDTLLDYCDKYYISIDGSLSNEIDNLLGIASFGDSTFSLLDDILDELDDFGAKEAMTFAYDENSDGVAIGFSGDKYFEELKSSLEKKYPDEGNKIEGKAEGAIIFDESGTFSSVGAKADFEYDVKKDTEAYAYNENIEINDLEVELTADYGSQKFNFPNFGDYKEIGTDILNLFESLL